MTDVQTEPSDHARGFRKVRTGRVISDKMEKTVVVQITDRKSHPLYKKVIGHRANLKVHDENNESKVGDLVRIVETRPISKDKRWRVAEIVERAR